MKALPDVFLITADSLRADYCSFITGKGRNTPFLKEIAKEGQVIKKFYSNGSFTAVSIPSVITGTLPHFKGSLMVGPRITLQEAFRALGYITVGAVSYNPLASAYSGKGKGFTFFVHPEVSDEVYASVHSSNRMFLDVARAILKAFRSKDREQKLRSLSLLRSFLQSVLNKNFLVRYNALLYLILEKLLLGKLEERLLYSSRDILLLERVKKLVKGISATSERPVFLWVHLNGSHLPYGSLDEIEGLSKFSNHLKAFERSAIISLALKMQEMADSWTRGKVTSYYIEGVRYIDFLMRNLFEEIVEKRKREFLFIFTADHGEELWDLGNYGHNFGKLEDPLVRVPFLALGFEEKLREKGSQIDIFPTFITEILKRYGAYKNKIWHRLLNLLDGKSMREEGENYIISETPLNLETVIKEMLEGGKSQPPEGVRVRATLENKNRIIELRKGENKDPKDELEEKALARAYYILYESSKDLQKELSFIAIRKALGIKRSYK